MLALCRDGQIVLNRLMEAWRLGDDATVSGSAACPTFSMAVEIEPQLPLDPDLAQIQAAIAAAQEVHLADLARIRKERDNLKTDIKRIRSEREQAKKDAARLRQGLESAIGRVRHAARREGHHALLVARRRRGWSAATSSSWRSEERAESPGAPSCWCVSALKAMLSATAQAEASKGMRGRSSP